MTITAVTPTPLVMKDCLMVIGTEHSFEKAITSVAFTPSATVISQAAVAPGAVYTDVSPATWTCDLTFLQDWADATSLCQLLFDSEGEQLACTFEPISGGATITATLVITPGAIGGPVGQFATSTVSLGVVGKPDIGA